jgi:3-oxoacyl-[acyl-carrier-protein] synthase-3
MDLFDLVLAPARAVLRQVPDPAVIQYLIFAHTVLYLTPPHIDAAQVLRERLGLEAEAFAVTQQFCASGFAAIDIAGELLRDDPDARALVIMGEKPFTPSARLVAGTTLVGEGSAACLVAAGGAGATIRSYATRTLGQFCEGVRVTPDVLNEFNESYQDNLVAVMEEAVKGAGLTMSDVTMVVPHNVSRLLWLRTIAELGLGRERIYLDNIPRYGHCSCADPFLNYTSLREEGRLTEGGIYLLTTVGMGATYAAMVIEQRSNGDRKLGDRREHSVPAQAQDGAGR